MFIKIFVVINWGEGMRVLLMVSCVGVSIL